MSGQIQTIREQEAEQRRSEIVNAGVPATYDTPRGPRRYVPTEQNRVIGAVPRLGYQYYVIGPNPRWLVAEIVPLDGVSWRNLKGTCAIALVSDTQSEIDRWNKLFQNSHVPGRVRRLHPGDQLPQWNLEAARLVGIQLPTEFIPKAHVVTPTVGQKIKSWWFRFRAQQVERWRDLKAGRQVKETNEYD